MSEIFKVFLCLCTLANVLIVISCQQIVPPETIPAIIKIDKVTSKSNYNTQGTDSQKITAVQLYSGSNNLGTYTLPATINWLDPNNTLITVFGAVDENGIKLTKSFYPFFQPDTLYANYKTGTTINLKPNMKYINGTVFNLIEDFESGNVFTKYSGDTTLIRVVNKSEAFQGSAYGALYFNGKVMTADIQNQIAFTKVPLTGVPFFVELNYKCNMPFSVGVESVKGTNAPVIVYPVTVNPKSNWNKIYINLTFNVQEAQADYYYLHISATKPDTLSSGYVYLDNVKVLHL